MIAAIEGGDETISKVDLVEFKALFEAFFFNILGLQVENNEVVSNEITDELMQLILDYRKAAKTEKNWAVADQIRDRLKELNISIKDGKDGADWSFENKN
jgi:cysteinyl-tRNA synthetase